jgi:hypothetical protein
MKRRSFAVLALLVMGVFLAGCQGSMLTAKGKPMDKSQQIMISKGGQQSGQYVSADLSVNYNYMQTADSLQISGIVQFDSSISGNYNTINNFELSLLLADTQGTVLKQQGLTSAYDNNPSTPINFSVTMSVPAQCESMAFAYEGQVSGVQTGPVSIGRYPVNEL